jgi:hypothetical protein
MNEPQIIIENQPLDIELASLLGEKHSDFLVLCFDGVQLDFFGTPYDSTSGRIRQFGLVEKLNSRSGDSLWPKMFSEWKREICEQFKLPTSTTAGSYRPVVSCAISRVCHGYSEHLHAAIGLFEMVGDKIEWWSTGKMSDGKFAVIINGKSGKEIAITGESLSVTITTAVRALLTSDKTTA